MKILLLINLPVLDIWKENQICTTKTAKHTIFYGYDYLKEKYGDDIIVVDSYKNSLIAKIINRVGHYLCGANCTYLQLKAIYYAYRYKVDIIYVHFMNIATVLSLLRRYKILNKKLVVIAQDAFSQRSTRLSVWKGCDKVLTLTEKTLELAKKKYDLQDINCEYIDWGADIEYYNRFYNSQRIKSNNNFIFATGVANRDYYTLIEAIREIPNVNLIIVSSNVTYVTNLPANVIIDTCMTRENTSKLLPYYYNCLAVAIPLKKKVDMGVGGTIMMETMAMHKPIIITNNQANLVNVFEEKIGIEVDWNDKKGWIKAIKYMENNHNEARSMGEKGYQLALSKYNYKNFCIQLDNILLEMNNLV